MLCGILKHNTQCINLCLLLVQLCLQCMNLRSLLGHLRDLGLNDFELSLSLFNLEVDHSYLLFFGADGLLSFL